MRGGVVCLSVSLLLSETCAINTLTVMSLVFPQVLGDVSQTETGSLGLQLTCTKC